MTINEFLSEIDLLAGWEIHELRNKKVKLIRDCKGQCPIVHVSKTSSNNFFVREAGENLGLKADDIHDIINASDRVDCFDVQELRREIINTCFPESLGY